MLPPIQLGLLPLFFLAIALGKDLKVFKRGKIELIDETQLERPNDYSQEFVEDVRKAADFGDIYDEQLAPLPRFELHKNGKYMGWTRLPIVTRKKAWWSTPLPKSRPGENPPFTYTPKMQLFTRPPPPPEEEEGQTSMALAQTNKGSAQKSLEQTMAPAKTTTRSAPSTVTSTFAPPTQTNIGRTRKLFTTKDTFPLLETSTVPLEIGTFPPKRPAKPTFTGSGRTNALEKLRKKLLFLRPSPQHAEVSVKSNSFAIRPAENTPRPFGAFRTTQRPPMSSTSIPGGPVPGGFAWSRSWRIGPDGRMEIRTWDREHGERVEQKQLNSEERRKWLPGFGSTTPSSSLVPLKVPFKPTLIQSNARPHIGPTFECRVLDAAVDGQPSGANDPTCPLDFPGIPSDGTCKCTYEATTRDDRGCATGFIYTCARKSNLGEAIEGEEQQFAAAASAIARQLQ